MTTKLAQARRYTCNRCGAQFFSDTRPSAKWSPKYCGRTCRYAASGESHSRKWRNDKAYAAKMAALSSERMKKRRNGGDPALNAILAKVHSARMIALWANPEFAAKISALQSAKIKRLNADPEFAARKRAASTWIMGRAARRLARDAEWRELMSVKTSEHMAREPWRQDVHGDYRADYMSMMCTRVQNDADVAALRNRLMSRNIIEAAREYRRRKNGGGK